MYYCGLDLGQKRDYSALAVLEKREARVGWVDPEKPLLRVRHLERMQLGTSYTAVVSRVCAVMRSPALFGQTRLVVDATGVGVPVVDLLRYSGLASVLTPVTITAGESANGRSEQYRVPRKDLLAGLEVLFETGDLAISEDLDETPALLRELEGMRMKKENESGHDDLVVAVALACWRARRKTVGFGQGRLL